eukprot:5318626-Prymnesium_polylepis.1
MVIEAGKIVRDQGVHLLDNVARREPIVVEHVPVRVRVVKVYLGDQPLVEEHLHLGPHDANVDATKEVREVSEHGHYIEQVDHRAADGVLEVLHARVPRDNAHPLHYAQDVHQLEHIPRPIIGDSELPRHGMCGQPHVRHASKLYSVGRSRGRDGTQKRRGGGQGERGGGVEGKRRRPTIALKGNAQS